MKDHILREDKFFQTHDKSRTWQRYCGFLDLSISEFLDIQEGLLLEQIDLVAESPLGRTIMKDQKPASLEEFRRTVPLTTYDDYLPYIGDGQETHLAEKPYYWVHTSYIKGSFKRVPWGRRFAEVQIRNVLAGLILSSATCKEDIRLAPGCKILAVLPEAPFVSARLAHGLVEQFSVKPIPPLSSPEKKGAPTFRKKIDEALRMALATDVDYIITMSSSFMPMKRGFQRVTENRSFISMLGRVHPLVFLRLLKNNPRRVFSRNGKLSPGDLWSVKGIVVWGADSNAFSGVVREQLGRPLFQFYGSSEAGLMAMQDWHKDKMVFLPDSVFFEFLPEEKIGQNDGASTVLLNELEYGKAYEPIITSFYGMPFLRYHQGDLIRISAPEKEGQLPRLEFCKRADDVIDLFGIARLNSKTLLEALELTGVAHGEWSVRKEYEKNKPVLELHIELGEGVDVLELGNRFHRKLKEVDRHYREAVFTLGYNPIRASRLPMGSFERYFREVRKNGHGGNGHDPDLYKLPQLNLTDLVIGELIQAGS